MPTPRRAEPKDAEQLAALAERTFRTTFGASNSSENMDAHCASAYGKTIQASEIANAAIETFVCDDGAELVGYAQLRWGVAPPCVPARRPAEIQRIYVDQRWHGKRIAHVLMSAVISASMRGGADQVWLGVWEHNLRALAFYRKFGFTKAGHHSFKLGNDLQQDWILSRTARLNDEVLATY